MPWHRDGGSGLRHWQGLRGPVGAALSERHITAVIPPRPSTRQAKAKGFPIERFHYNARRDIVRRPRKKVMTPRVARQPVCPAYCRWFRADADACRTCPLRACCIPDAGASRRVHITATYVEVLRARRKRLAWGAMKTVSTPATAGWSEARMDSPKPCMDWPEPPGAASKT